MNPLAHNNIRLTTTKFKGAINPSKTNMNLNYVIKDSVRTAQ